jgi:16S rRNA (guanine527-N7)-methyltransferase
MDQAAEKIELYLAEIRKWNRRINLVSAGDLEKLYERHYLDSLVLAKRIPRGAKLLDMGSGNGFPSIPIAVHRPDVFVTALEIKKKKAFFLENVKRKLELANYSILNMDIDSNPPAMESAFDSITARAYKDLTSVLGKARYYCKNGGALYHYKTLSLLELRETGERKEKVVHSVNKIVYKLKTGETGEILQIEIRK